MDIDKLMFSLGWVVLFYGYLWLLGISRKLVFVENIIVILEGSVD